MASTILEQVLENVSRGAYIPLRDTGAPMAQSSPPLGARRLDEAIGRVAAELLDEVDAGLEALTRRALRQEALASLPLQQTSVIKKITSRFSDAAAATIADRALAPQSTPDESPSSSRPPATEAAPPEPKLAELNELLKQLQEIPRLIQERADTSRESEILEQLNRLSQEVGKINRAEGPSAAHDEATAADSAAAPRVPLHDIQQMIEFLK